MKERMTKSNSISGNIWTVFSSAILIVGTFLAMVLIEAVFLFAGVEENYVVEAFPRILVAVMILWIFKKKHPEWTIGMNTQGLGNGILVLGWIMLVATVMNFLDAIAMVDWNHALEPKVLDYITYTLYVLSIGLFEEAILRGVVLNRMLSKWGYKKAGVYAAVLASSILFGLWHLINLVSCPWLIVSTGIQVVYASFIGIYFAAIYLRTNNLWTVILLHSLFDFAGCFGELFDEQVRQGMIPDIPLADGILTLLPCTVFLIAGLYYLRKVEVLHQEIDEVVDEHEEI